MDEMDLIRFLKIGGWAVALLTAFLFGFSQGQNKKELESAKSEIIQLEKTILELESRKTADAVAMADLRIAESNSRNELDRMRQQLASIERMSKTNADRERNRCLRLAVEGRELLDRAQRAIKFCETNHR